MKTKILAYSFVGSAGVLGAFTANAALVSWSWQLQTLPGATRNLNAFGTFTTEGDALTPTAVLSIDGFWNGMTIVGLQPANTNCMPLCFDQLVTATNETSIFATSLPFSLNGLVFRTGEDENTIYQSVNLYSKDGANWASENWGNGLSRDIFAFRVEVTAGHESLPEPPIGTIPEPASLALVACGLLGLMVSHWKKRQSTLLIRKV